VTQAVQRDEREVLVVNELRSDKGTLSRLGRSVGRHRTPATSWPHIAVSGGTLAGLEALMGLAEAEDERTAAAV